MPNLWPYDDRRWLLVDKAFVGVFLILFVYNLLVWGGVMGGEAPWRPGQSVMLAGALLLQGLASLARHRSRALFYVLLSASLIALGFTFLAR